GTAYGVLEPYCGVCDEYVGSPAKHAATLAGINGTSPARTRAIPGMDDERFLRQKLRLPTGTDFRITVELERIRTGVARPIVALGTLGAKVVGIARVIDLERIAGATGEAEFPGQELGRRGELHVPAVRTIERKGIAVLHAFRGRESGH